MLYRLKKAISVIITFLVTVVLSVSYASASGVSHELAVQRSGDCTGRVKSLPPGIDYGEIGSADFDEGTIVTLSAYPGEGCAFGGWGDDCVSAALTCKVKMEADKNVTASFFPAETSITTWVKTYGGTGDDYAYSIQQTSDGGFIVAGESTSFGTVYADVWILKLAADGAREWQYIYAGDKGNDTYNLVQSIGQTSDGGYIVAGATYAFDTASYDVWVAKHSSTGAVEWQYLYGGADSMDDFAESVQETTDGGYIVAGHTHSFGAGNYDVWIMKLFADGSVEWQKTYGGAGEDNAFSIQQTSDGGYIVAGDTLSFYGSSSNVWVIKLDPEGVVEWQKAYDAGVGLYYHTYDYARGIRQTAAGGYVLAGYTLAYSPYEGSSSYDAWVLKLFPDGSVDWQKTYGGTQDDAAESVSQTADGGYIVAGYTKSFEGGNRGSGRISDGGYIDTGRTKANGAGNRDVWILKLDAEGNVSDCNGVVRNTDATVTDTNATSAETSVEGVESDALVYVGTAIASATLVDHETVCPVSASPIDGLCGSSHGGSFTSAPTTGLCTAGTPTVVGGTGPWTWQCQGLNGGSTASCSANIQTYPITTAASPTAGGTVTCNPNPVNHGSTSQCNAAANAGYALDYVFGCNAPSGPSPYTTGSVTAPCTVTATFTLTPINGVCGTANGGTFTAAPTTGLCTAGTPTVVGGTGPWTWQCQGLNGGSTASCSANIQTYTITTVASPTAGGTVTCNPNPVNHGSTSQCSAAANAGYTLDYVFGCNAPSGSSPYTTGSVTAPCTVTAYFSLKTYTISGVVTSGGTGLEGVAMNGLPGNPVTGSTGAYTATVNHGWSGTVSPAKAGYLFTPPSTAYTNVTSNQTQNYTASQMGTMTPAYITNSGGNTVTFINAQKQTSPITVGNRPIGVAVNPAATRAYITNYNSNSVSTINTATNTVVGSAIRVGTNPVGIAVSPDGNVAFVANYGNGRVSVLDLARNRVSSTLTGFSGPSGVAVTPDGSKGYVTNYTGGRVSVITRRTAFGLTRYQVSNITTGIGSGPYGVAVHPSGMAAYVTNYGDGYPGGNGTVSVINTATNTVAGKITVGRLPSGVAVSPDGKILFVANYGDNTVSVIDLSVNKVVETVNVGPQPYGIAVNSSGGQIVVAHRGTNTVGVIDIASLTMAGTVTVGNAPAAFGNFLLPGGPEGLAYGASLPSLPSDYTSQPGYSKSAPPDPPHM